jgi:acetolactate synthase-1/2/3 large subunit
MPIGYGSLGTALPMAIGASLAAPGRPVLALAGDGGAVFTIQELATARDLGLALPFVVWDNGGYGEIRDAMRAAQVPVLGCDAATHDLPRVAEGFGCRGARAESLGHLGQLIADALQASVPTLIAVDPSTRGIDG